MSSERVPQILYHATSKENGLNIARVGLQARTVTPTGQRRLYAVDSERVEWLVEHVTHRHAIAPDEVIVYQFAVHHRWRYYNRGIWYSLQAVPPFDFIHVWRAADGLV